MTLARKCWSLRSRSQTSSATVCCRWGCGLPTGYHIGWRHGSEACSKSWSLLLVQVADCSASLAFPNDLNLLACCLFYLLTVKRENSQQRWMKQYCISRGRQLRKSGCITYSRILTLDLKLPRIDIILRGFHDCDSSVWIFSSIFDFSAKFAFYSGVPVSGSVLALHADSGIICS